MYFIKCSGKVSTFVYSCLRPFDRCTLNPWSDVTNPPPPFRVCHTSIYVDEVSKIHPKIPRKKIKWAVFSDGNTRKPSFCHSNRPGRCERKWVPSWRWSPPSDLLHQSFIMQNRTWPRNWNIFQTALHDWDTNSLKWLVFCDTASNVHVGPIKSNHHDVFDQFRALK